MLYMLYITNKMEHFDFKSEFSYMGDKVFKRRLACSVALANAALHRY